MKMDALNIEDIKATQSTVNSITSTPLLSDRDDNKSKQDQASATKPSRRRRKKAKGVDPAEAMN